MGGSDRTCQHTTAVPGSQPRVLLAGTGRQRCIHSDVDGKSYLDFLAGNSFLNFGHRHPDLIAAATGGHGTTSDCAMRPFPAVFQ